MLQQIYDELDDKDDICNYFKALNIDDSNYIGYKHITECGDINIIINELDGTEKINILYSLSLCDPLNRPVISTFYYDKHIGIFEKIYYDKTEYFINGQFYGTILTYDISNLINKITSLVLHNRIFPTLYNFIESDDEITLLPKNEFNYETIKNMFI